MRHGDQFTATDYTYTGQYSNVSDFGLMFYNARWYDPALGRFTQPDTIVPNAADPQSWNRYAYVVNNPLRFVDPTGHRVACGAMGDACEHETLTPGKKGYDWSREEDRSITKRVSSGATLAPWDQPTSWDLDPSHPDYWVVTGSFTVFTGSVEIDRYGQWFFGVGPGVDALSTFFGVPGISVRAGNINGYGGNPGGAYEQFPDPAGTEAFLKGFSVNGGGGIVGGASETWVPFAGDYVEHTGTEWGAYLPGSLGGSARYAFSGHELQQLASTLSNALSGGSK